MTVMVESTDALLAAAAEGEQKRQAELERIYGLARLPSWSPYARVLEAAKRDRATTPESFAGRLLAAMGPGPIKPARTMLTPAVLQRRETTRKMEWDATVTRAIAGLLIPQPFTDATLEGFDVDGAGRAEALDFARGFVERWPNVNGLVVLQGHEGSGKRYWAFATLSALIRRHGVAAKWTTLAGLAGYLRLASKNRQAAIRCDALLRAEVLLVANADAGAAFAHPKNRARDVGAFLTERHEAGRPTFITTQSHPMDLLGPRTMSHLAANGGWLRIESRA